MSDAIYLKDCPHCQGNKDFDCWCEGKGKVLIYLPEIDRLIKVEEVKLKYYENNKQEHFDSKINYYEDYDNNDDVTEKAKERINNEVLDDIANSIKEINRLEKLIGSFNFDYRDELSKKYKMELATSALCSVCDTDNREYICRTCNNNPENIFNEEATQNFKGINEQAQYWYDKLGYKLETY